MALLAHKHGDSCCFRLDPYKTEHHISLGNKTYKLNSNGAVIKRTVASDLPMTMAVPAKAFKAVAARAVEDKDGKVTVTLELLHHDPEMCVPLLMAHDMNDISADWHSWSRLMKLPMMIIDMDNNQTQLTKQLGSLMVASPIERRKRITTVKHRPNFLRRRRIGVVSPIVKLSSKEIIARI